MKKTKKIALLSAVILSSLALFAHPGKSSSHSPKQPIIFSAFSGKAWVESCVQQYPEILWLADADVRKTEEGLAVLQGTYSEQLFGQKYIEFDRTIMTLHCLRLILEGGEDAYQVFTLAQPLEAKLSYESFQTLHEQGVSLLKSQWGGMSELQMAEAMETALVLGDIGKSEKARAVFKSYHISAPDHDDFHGEVMKILKENPDLCPSFARLCPAAQTLLVEVANLAHYGHITHLEGGARMFSHLKTSQVPVTDPVALSFDLFVHTCDVAGALGHANNQSSIVYTEPTHKAMQAMGQAVRVLSDPEKNEWDAYSAYVRIRASWLNLDSTDSKGRVLARIGAMLRLFTPEEGDLLKQAMQELDASTQARIAHALDVQKNDQPLRTPTYMPAVLVNLSSNPQLGLTKEEKLSKAITLGLPFIAAVLEKHQEMVEKQEIDPNIPLNFNKMAGVAKSSPEQLSQEFYIDREGNVLITSLAL